MSSKNFDCITITEENYRSFVNPHILGQGKGLIPRDFKAHPVGYLGAVAQAFDPALLIPESEWDALIDEQEQTKSSLQHLMDFYAMDALNQNGQGYCWFYSTTGCVQLVHAKQGQTDRLKLSGHMGACLVKNYRDQGGWNTQSLNFAKEHGIASQKFWPQGSMSRSNDTPEMRADAKKSKITEWWDLSDNGGEAKKQLASLLLRGVAVACDYNWWGHSVTVVRLVKRDPFTVRIRNSWGNSWSNNGYGDLVGSKAIPNGATAARVTRIAA